MAQNKIYKFKDIVDLYDFLNGAVTGGDVVKGQTGQGSALGVPVGLQNLVGKTLIFTSPSSVTVTFAQSSGAGGSAASPNTNPDPNTLLFLDIRAQIQAAIPTVKVKTSRSNNLVLIESTPTSGVTVSHTGTANSILGFATDQDAVGKVYKPSTITVTPPVWVWLQTDNNGELVVSTWE